MPERVRSFNKTPPLIVLPALSWFLWFLLIPLGIVFVYSFATKGPYGNVIFQFSFEQYVRVTDWLYLKIFWNSFKLALFTGISCLLIGYPLAYVMATSTPGVRSLLLVLVMIPFWTNFVVRTYAIKLLLGENGPINQLALALKVTQEPIVFTNSFFAVWLGMVTNYLPFMVLPLYVALEKFDFTLLEAAKDLGASAWDIFWKVLFPLTQRGIIAGVIFVFTPALGEFVIPDLLGGAKTMLIGNLITDQFLKTRDWPFGSALSLVLILFVLGSLSFHLRAADK